MQPSGHSKGDQGPSIFTNKGDQPVTVTMLKNGKEISSKLFLPGESFSIPSPDAILYLKIDNSDGILWEGYAPTTHLYFQKGVLETDYSAVPPMQRDGAMGMRAKIATISVVVVITLLLILLAFYLFSRR